jgi:hypothetical protein
MKKLRITPLNIVAALALAFFVVSFFQTEQRNRLGDFNNLYKGILGALIIVAFITDMIFRFIFKELKRIWFVELFFIALTIILFLILQK